MQATAEHAIQAAGLVRRFDDVTALDQVSIDIRRGEFFSLLGPSGCGKTTFLRIVAGLDRPDAGTLCIGGRDALPIPAHRRAVNTVFQSYALFPHMTVEQNVAFGLKMKRVPRDEMRARVGRALELTQITELAARKPHQISGGQKQRVALARALINEPDVLLLDEPLAALDVKLRRELQQELHALQRRLGVTFVLVTHDQDEALTLSDRIAVMNAGRIVQLASAREIYEQPRNRFVAEFVGGCNVIEATRREARVAVTALGEVQLPTNLPRDRVTLAVRPERVLLGPGPNSFDACIMDTSYTGAETHLVVKAGGCTVKIATVNSGGAARAEAGQTITAHIPPEALLVLED